MVDQLPEGSRTSPNIWNDPQIYELENRALDPDDLLDTAMRSVQDWHGRDLLDIGCGSGFHLPRFARDAGTVTGVEPYPALLTAARERLEHPRHADVAHRVRVRSGTAQAIPLPDRSVDVAHARWAYFFGPGCEPGLVELGRVIRPGGAAFIIDHDATASTFGRWFSRQWPSYDAVAIERFWRRQGWTRIPVTIRWAMASRADFEAVIRIEFSTRRSEAILAEHDGCEVDHAVNIWWRRFGESAC